MSLFPNFDKLVNMFTERLDKIDKKLEKLTERVDKQNEKQLLALGACKGAFDQIKLVCEALNENIDEASGTLTAQTWF